MPYSKLTHKLTIKMIIDTDNYLKMRGMAIQWLERSEYINPDIATKYQSYPVCEKW